MTVSQEQVNAAVEATPAANPQPQAVVATTNPAPNQLAVHLEAWLPSWAPAAAIGALVGAAGAIGVAFWGGYIPDGNPDINVNMP